MGFPTTLSMAAGALVGWGILAPLSQREGWAPGPTGDMATGARGWILWISLAIMCADSIVSLFPILWELIETRVLRRDGALHLGSEEENETTEDKEVEPPERLVPTSWVIYGLVGSVALGALLIWIVFGEKPWATVIGFVAGSALSVLGYVTHLFTKSRKYLILSSQRSRSWRDRSQPCQWARKN
jgi:uncharacterized oligopeptide transporter (OPT) family protein